MTPTGPGLVDVAGHDADLALAGRDDAGAVGADEPARLAAQLLHDAGHVEDGDALGDATMTPMPASAASRMASAAPGGGTKIIEALAPVLRDRLGDGVEEREALLLGAALAGLDGADDVGAVVAALLGVEGAGLAEALDEQAGVLVDEDAHDGEPFECSCRNSSISSDEPLVGRLIQVTAVPGQGQVAAQDEQGQAERRPVPRSGRAE